MGEQRLPFSSLSAHSGRCTMLQSQPFVNCCQILFVLVAFLCHISSIRSS